jgi:thiamine biosynthesis protein ThiC
MAKILWPITSCDKCPFYIIDPWSIDSEDGYTHDCSLGVDLRIAKSDPPEDCPLPDKE